MSLSLFLTVALKMLVARPRPPRQDVPGPIDHSYSFQSGHTLSSAVLLALVVWLLWGRASAVGRTLLIGCVVLLGVGIGASGIYLGYLWATDVAASWLVTLGVLPVVALVSGPLVRAVTVEVTLPI